MSGITVACLFLSKFMFPQVLEILSNETQPGYTNDIYIQTITFSPQGAGRTHNLLVKAIIWGVHTRLMKTEHWNYGVHSAWF